MIESLIKNANDVVEKDFSIKIERSKVMFYSQERWGRFCMRNGFEESDGLYIPHKLKAYINLQSPLLETNIFHELFGHGLFCEHSLLGKELLLAEEKNYLYNIQKKELGFAPQRIADYEGFAHWMEAYLCHTLGKEKLWEEKEKSLAPERKRIFHLFNDLEKQLGLFFFMAQLGFPKVYQAQDLSPLLKKIFPQETKIDFALLYGSKKPESDIDIFLVSEYPSQNIFNGWLDIYSLERKEFACALHSFDVSVLEPLFGGEIILGDLEYIKSLQNEVKKQKITRKAIEYNLRKIKEQKEATSIVQTEREQRVAVSYAETYRKTAELLAQGKRVLGRADLDIY